MIEKACLIINVYMTISSRLIEMHIDGVLELVHYMV